MVMAPIIIRDLLLCRAFDATLDYIILMHHTLPYRSTHPFDTARRNMQYPAPRVTLVQGFIFYH